MPEYVRRVHVKPDDIAEVGGPVTHNIDCRIDEDDGWIVLSCGCGWGQFPMPDIETAIDFYAQHCVEMALSEDGQ